MRSERSKGSRRKPEGWGEVRLNNEREQKR
jgi:hypothetical protein